MIDRLLSLDEALRQFVGASATQSQAHIRSLHWHLAQRLVIEGGFRPEEITPRPPLRIETIGSGANRICRLHFDASAARDGEQTVLGGLKTKSVDVVVSKPGIGPCVAISIKGTLNAFRNLTNRMEEAAGDCTNLHISYPTLVYGFFHVMRANREGYVANRNDIAVFADGTTTDGIIRYHDAMSRITGRNDVRDDVSRYEAVALVLATADGETAGEPFLRYPGTESLLQMGKFFPAIYTAYDLRFVYTAPALSAITARLVRFHFSCVGSRSV